MTNNTTISPDRTKEEILNDYNIIVYKDTPDSSDVAFCNDDVKSAMEVYAKQEKRKTAIAFLAFATNFTEAAAANIYDNYFNK